MANIDGEWESVAQSPMGEQRSTITLASLPDGGFSGSSSGPMGSAEISDGQVAGDQVSFKMKIKTPFPMTLSVDGRLEDDTISGSIDTGAFGKFPMKATRKV